MRRCLLIIVLLEVFVFNFRFWCGLFAGKETVLKYDLVETADVGEGRFLAGERTELIFRDVEGLSLSNIRIDVENVSYPWKVQGTEEEVREFADREAREAVTNVVIHLRDEGHAEEYELPPRAISPVIRNSGFLSLYPFGKIRSMRITFANDMPKAIRIGKITANTRPEFVLSWIRLFLLTAAAWLLLTAAEHPEDYREDSLRHNKMLVVSGLLALVVLLYFQKQTRTDQLNGYADLAKSLTQGHLWIEGKGAEVLSALSNPYDVSERQAAGGDYLWDTAFYNGKYYVYFGVIPVFLFYLPYYLLTGQDLTHYRVHCILLAGIVIGSILLLRSLYRFVGRRISFGSYLLLNTAVPFSVGTVLLAKRSEIYHVAQGSGLCLTIWGLYFWYSAAAKELEKPAVGRLLAGSLCMALAVGCRPQFVFYNILALPLFFGYLLKADREKAQRDGRAVLRKTLQRAALVLAPYVPVAAGLMYYNYVRFGSVADFGANYNLTAYDMTHMGVHLGRMTLGLWYYLLEPPKFSFEFPFLVSVLPTSGYQGYMYCERQIGGAIFLIPFTLVIFACAAKWKELRETGTALMFVQSLSVTAVLTVFDVVLCGFLVRYQMDFRLGLVLAAVLLIFASRMDGKVMRVLYVLTLLLALLTMLAQFETPDHQTLNPVFYYRMKQFWGLLDY